MRRNYLHAAVLTTTLGACVVEPELLNSERVESQFGNFGIEVLSYTDGVRRSRLYSTAAGVETCRTYAVVRFDDVATAGVGAVHERVLNGASIGAAFKASGWQVLKQTRFIGEIELEPDPHAVYAMMRLPDTPPLAMHVYRLLVRKGERVVTYATIIELHHPQYLTRDEVHSIFAVEPVPAPAPAELADWFALFLEPA